LAGCLDHGDVLAVAPTRDIDLTGCSWLVREYYGVRSRLPSSREGIGGSGVYALSDAGRRRFGQFPDIIADDTYVRVQFKPEERATLASIKSKVFPPRTIRELISIRTRGYAGTFELANRYPELFSNRGETNNQALTKLFTQPRLWPGLLVYCFVTTFARYRAIVRSRARASVWQRDDTSRIALSADTPK
jgi:hypothetical protein